jgi:tetratricopeptide (TPR) repeat protein
LAAALATRELLAQTDLGPLWLGAWRGEPALIRVLPRGGSHGASRMRQALRATADLRHPGIARTLGFGLVTGALAARTGLEEGRLYVATDPPWTRVLAGTPMTWSKLRFVIDQVLTALGTLHARGLVHGDIRPDTLEMEGTTVRLRDVGLRIAAMREGLLPLRPDDDRMAPELRQGLWRELGPSVDLYAVAWTVRDRARELDVPDGLEGWLDRLTTGRVVRASEAARELAAVDGERSDVFTPVVARATPRLVAGSGLMGREEQKKSLWAALTRVRRGEVGVAIVQGPSGSGRSAMVNWLATHAQENGHATVLRGSYSPTGAVREGLGRLIVQHLGCRGLEGAALKGRLTTRLRSWAMAEPWEVRGLMGVVDPMSFPVDPEDARLRPTVVRRFLEACVTRRRPGEWARTEPTPLVVVLEEVQWGLEAFALAQLLLRTSKQPILLVMTLSTDEVTWHEGESAALAELAEVDDARVRIVPLPPMEADVLARVASSVLPPELALRVARTARGNPLHVAEMAAWYEERGRPETLPLPDSLAAVLTQRIENRELRFALELLACLGQEAPLSEWRSVCSAWGLEAHVSWLEDMADRGIVVLDVHTNRVRITHAALRRALLSTAEREGRLTAHHRACATVLMEHEARNRIARVGNHHFAAGDPHLAVPALLSGAEERIKQARASAAMKLLAHAATALDRVREGVDESQRARLWILQSQAMVLQGRLREAVETSENAAARARWTANPTLLGQALAERARTARVTGDLSVALGNLREALPLLEGSDKAAVHLDEGAVLSDLGALDEASEALQQARATFMVTGDRGGLARSLHALGDVALRRGDVAWAATLLEAARQGYSEIGSAWGAMSCHNSLGELWRAKGDLEGAERHYRAATSLARAMDTVEGLVPEVNRGIVMELQGRHREAAVVLTQCLHEADRRGARLLSAVCHVALLPALAGTNEVEALDAHFALGTGILRATGYIHGDIAQLARLAGERVHGERQAQLFRLAAAQYRQLGQLKEVSDLTARLAQAERAPLVDP